jgi:nitrogen-specific signal transduction histidine kinase
VVGWNGAENSYCIVNSFALFLASMSVQRRIMELSHAILYCVADNSGNIVFQNAAFSKGYTHIRPSKSLHLGDGIVQLINRAYELHEMIHSGFVTIKDTEGGHMIVAYEVFFKDEHFHFVGLLQVEIEQADEAALAALRKARKSAIFHLSHNVRAPLSKIIGLSDLLLIDGQQSEIIEMIANASRELDEALKALGEILNREI